MKATISLIVPVYNVKSYLPDCLESLSAQTFSSLEILLVDDGSTDGSGGVCDAWAEKDSRVKVIHKTNGGVASARNAGLSAASGQYIGFVDPDDRVEPDMFEKLYRGAVDTGAQVTACGYLVHENGAAAAPSGPEQGEMTAAAALRHLLLWDGAVTSFLWNKLFCRETVDGIRFREELWVGEDTPFLYGVLSRSQSYCHIPEPLYHYYRRGDSLIGSGYRPASRSSALAARLVAQQCMTEFPELTGEARCHASMNAFIQLNILLKTHGWRGRYLQDYRDLKKQMKYAAAGDIRRHYSGKKTAQWMLLRHCPGLYGLLLNWNQRRKSGRNAT